MPALQCDPSPLVHDLVARLDALSRWTEGRRDTAVRAARTGVTREDRLDGARDVEVRERELEVFLARLDAQDTAPWGSPGPCPAALVAHRHEWLRRQVVNGLAEHGVEVVLETENGADIVGAALADRPALVVVDERLAMRTGLDTVRELRAVLPDLRIAATVGYDDDVAAMLAAGATRVFTRRVPPVALVAELAALATGSHDARVARQRRDGSGARATGPSVPQSQV